MESQSNKYQTREPSTRRAPKWSQFELIDPKQWAYIIRRYHLSPRGLDVARLVCRGLTNIDIAAELKVKPGTAKTHLRSIFGKTRARSKITMLLTFVADTKELYGSGARRSAIPVVELRSSGEEKTADESIFEDD